MKKYLGIDLGTSAVKLLLATPDGNCKRVKCSYRQADISGWYEALKSAVAQLKEQDSLEDLCAIALSAQVGTYITDTGEILSWQSAAGSEELAEIQKAFTQGEWVQHIGMAHPELSSYPLPRLLYIKRHFPQCKAVMMPKELFLKELTGNAVTDVFSWRGLCHPDKLSYSQVPLDRFEISISLPSLARPTDLAGTVTAAAAEKYGLPEHIPVYVGCNDFYAGLLGMGIWENGQLFELSGTSEHIGVLTRERIDGKLISGKFFNGFATYGGTKSSGVSCDFAITHFDAAQLDADYIPTNPPIFLPYLNGERAPVYDDNATGVFFGITGNTTRQDMAYAVLEGVVFSLYHISEKLPFRSSRCMITGGGSSSNKLMARLKSELFGLEILQVQENDSSALGAAMLAMAGHGEYDSLEQTVRSMVRYTCVAKPGGSLHDKLLSRYALYKSLYASLKNQFEAFAKL